MAMPTSGCIGLRDCVTGINCSSISCAVAGVACSPASLSSLSIQAGKSAPHSMSEFYSYAPVTTKYVDFTCITCTGNNTAIARACSSIDVNPALIAGEFYCPNFCWLAISDDTYGVFAIVTVARNGSTVCSINIPAGNYCYGSYSMCIAYGDAVCITTCARVAGINLGVANEACLCLYSMAGGGCSNIYKGTTRTLQYSYTCGAIV